ncbi:hypothetical protein N7535_005418 [Penicillium sp. DV-2018c]|nr:hypothetical protein N7535_005418 [Penicillium sp. DV-2018c]
MYAHLASVDPTTVTAKRRRGSATSGTRGKTTPDSGAGTEKERDGTHVALNHMPCIDQPEMKIQQVARAR